MDVFLNQLFVGLSIASILLLIALGLTFTFGQMNVTNMAHGEFIMAGAYTTYVLQTALGTGAITLAFGLSLPLAFLVAGRLGLPLEATVIPPRYGRRTATRPGTLCRGSARARPGRCAPSCRTCRSRRSRAVARRASTRRRSSSGRPWPAS